MERRAAQEMRLQRRNIALQGSQRHIQDFRRRPGEHRVRLSGTKERRWRRPRLLEGVLADGWGPNQEGKQVPLHEVEGLLFQPTRAEDARAPSADAAAEEHEDTPGSLPSKQHNLVLRDFDQRRHLHDALQKLLAHVFEEAQTPAELRCVLDVCRCPIFWILEQRLPRSLGGGKQPSLLQRHEGVLGKLEAHDANGCASRCGARSPRRKSLLPKGVSEPHRRHLRTVLRRCRAQAPPSVVICVSLCALDMNGDSPFEHQKECRARVAFLDDNLAPGEVSEMHVERDQQAHRQGKLARDGKGLHRRDDGVRFLGLPLLQGLPQSPHKSSEQPLDLRQLRIHQAAILPRAEEEQGRRFQRERLAPFLVDNAGRHASKSESVACADLFYRGRRVGDPSQGIPMLRLFAHLPRGRPDAVSRRSQQLLIRTRRCRCLALCVAALQAPRWRALPDLDGARDDDGRRICQGLERARAAQLDARVDIELEEELQLPHAVHDPAHMAQTPLVRFRLQQLLKRIAVQGKQDTFLGGNGALSPGKLRTHHAVHAYDTSLSHVANIRTESRRSPSRRRASLVVPLLALASEESHAAAEHEEQRVGLVAAVVDRGCGCEVLEAQMNAQLILRRLIEVVDEGKHTTRGGDALLFAHALFHGLL
eukprot:scaffold1846_cov236-Pinguiococcus_pyrenoidosus.AAC.2